MDDSLWIVAGLAASLGLFAGAAQIWPKAVMVLHAECFQILPDDSGAQNGLYVTNYYHPAKVIGCSDALFRYFVDRQFLIGGLKKFRVYLRPDQNGGAAQIKPQAENHHPGGTGPPEPHESPLIQVALSLLTS